MSTTVSGPPTPEARRITSSGTFHRSEPLGGVTQPPLHVALPAADVGGGVAGVAGEVGGAVGFVDDVVATGVGIAAVDVAAAPPEQAVPNASTVR